jgi:hypothetical protein
VAELRTAAGRVWHLSVKMAFAPLVPYAAVRMHLGPVSERKMRGRENKRTNHCMCGNVLIAYGNACRLEAAFSRSLGTSRSKVQVRVKYYAYKVEWVINRQGGIPEGPSSHYMTARDRVKPPGWCAPELPLCSTGMSYDMDLSVSRTQTNAPPTPPRASLGRPDPCDTSDFITGRLAGSEGDCSRTCTL